MTREKCMFVLWWINLQQQNFCANCNFSAAKFFRYLHAVSKLKIYFKVLDKIRRSDIIYPVVIFYWSFYFKSIVHWKFIWHYFIILSLLVSLVLKAYLKVTINWIKYRFEFIKTCGLSPKCFARSVTSNSRDFN